MRKLLVFFLGFMMLFQPNLVNASDTEAVPLIYPKEGTEVMVGEGMLITGGSAEVKENSTLLFELEDGRKISVGSIESYENPGHYYFYVFPNEGGLWKALEFDGQPLGDASFEIRAFETMQDYYAFYQRPMPDIETKVERIAGENRYETASELYKNSGTSQAAVIASGENFPDALFGGPLAAELNAPLLLTPKNTLHPEVINRLNEMDTRDVYLLGGEHSISENVEKELVNLGLHVQRIAGQNRRETAGQISVLSAQIHGIKIVPDAAVLVDGQHFPDALTAAPFVHALRMLDEYRYFLPCANGPLDKEGITVIGGPNSVPMHKNESRIYGANRYETALEVAKAFRTQLKVEPHKIFLVSGDNYPDALATGPIAATESGVILLTTKDRLYPGVKEYIEENRQHLQNIIIVGGESSIHKSVEQEVISMIEQ